MVEFVRGRGYVLDFSDARFSEFFEIELNVDIDASVYAGGGTSKGRRLRTFLTKADNATVIKTLQTLWEYRCSHLCSTQIEDPVPNAEGRLLTLIQRLNGNTSPATGLLPKPAYDRDALAALSAEFYGLRNLKAHARGYAFEAFLNRAFDAFALQSRAPFRNVGEQIDGSFILDNQIYLLEAKWTRSPIGAGELHAFHGKLDKAAWTRGVFVSYIGFSEEGLRAPNRTV